MMGYKNPYLSTKIVTWALGFLGVCVFLSEGSLVLTKPCGEEKECQGLEYCRQYDHSCQPCKDICDLSSNNLDGNRCEQDCQDYIHDERYVNLQNSTLYELHSNLEEKYKELEKDVLILKILVGVCIAVIVIVVSGLLAFLVYFWNLVHPPQDNPEKKKGAGATKPAELPTVYNQYPVTTPTPEISPSSVSISTFNNNHHSSTLSGSPVDTNITTVSASSDYPPKTSPTRSDTSICTPATATTTLSTVKGASYALDGVRNGVGCRGSVPNSNRFRREPSESTLPDGAYDNLSMSPQHTLYSHHV